MDQNGIDRDVFDQLRQDLGPENFATALAIFVKDLRERVAVLQASELDAAALRRQAHAIKGAAATFGFSGVAQAAAALDCAARLNEADRFDALLRALASEADAARRLAVA